MDLQGGSYSLQGGSTPLQGGAVNLQGSSPNLQPAVNPQNFVDPVNNSTAVLGASTQVDPAVAAQAAQAAADAARAASLRGQVSDLVSQIKGIFNARYGQVDSLAGEQSGKLNDRFANESGDLTKQIEGQNQQIGAAHAASGTFDSSYRGNNVDTSTQAGQAQIRDLGQELQDNIAKIAAWVTSQKANLDAQNQGYDATLNDLPGETSPTALASTRDSVEQALVNAKAGSADYNTAGKNAAALDAIAPSSTRAVQLKTTLSQIIAGSADPSQKAAIGQSLITNSGVSPQDQQQLLLAFQSDLNTKPQTDTNNQPITA